LLGKDSHGCAVAHIERLPDDGSPVIFTTPYHLCQAVLAAPQQAKGDAGLGIMQR
jgi:hypothetical protein